MTVYRQTATRWVNAGEGLLPLLEKVLTWAVIATVFFLPTSEALKNIFFVVALALYVVVIFASRERIVVSPVGWLLLSFLGAAILSAVASPYPGKAMEGVWDVFRATSFFFIGARGIREDRHVRVVCWVIVASWGITALVTILRYLQHYSTGGVGTLIDALSVGGIDSAALYAVMGLALMFGMYVHTDVVGWRLVLLVTIASLSVIVLGITHTRMLWGGFILMLLVLGWLRSARVAFTVIALSVLMVFGIALVDPQVSSNALNLTSVEAYRKGLGGGGVRAELRNKAIAMWRDAPWIGVGPKAFKLHDDVAHNPQRSKYGPLQGHPHNEWLRTAVEMGSLGVLILAATFVYLGFWLIDRRRRFSFSWRAAVWDGAFGCWLAILVGSLTEPNFGQEHAMFFMLLLALLQAEVPSGKASAAATKGPEI
ncbi:MAG: O-antigen ligase family protein [Candidatus Methylomirabilales bacterium]